MSAESWTTGRHGSALFCSCWMHCTCSAVNPTPECPPQLLQPTHPQIARVVGTKKDSGILQQDRVKGWVGMVVALDSLVGLGVGVGCRGHSKPGVTGLRWQLLVSSCHWWGCEGMLLQELQQL